MSYKVDINYITNMTQKLKLTKGNSQVLNSFSVVVVLVRDWWRLCSLRIMQNVACGLIRS